jgi:hypothetical protein
MPQQDHEGHIVKLWVLVVELKEILESEMRTEESLFGDRFNGSFISDLEHFDRWRIQHAKVMAAFERWRSAVDEYQSAALISVS